MTTATQPQTKPHDTPAGAGGWGWIVFGIAAAAVAGAAVWYYQTHPARAAHASPGGGGQTEGKAPTDPVQVATVRTARGGIVRTSTQIGSVAPYEDADLYAKVSGYLATLHADYGDHVKRDQLLVEIDDPEVIEDARKADADVAQAKAAVAQADAFIESAKADREASSSAVEQAVAEVERFVSMRNFHAKKLARYKELVKGRAIPQQIADEEEESFESARASELASRKAVLNSRAQLVAAGARVKKAEADREEAKANQEVAHAKLARAKVLVGYTKIRSPYDGVVTKRNFFRGAFIRSAAEGGTVPLMSVARTDKVRVVTQVPDRDVPYVDIGDDAEVTLDALNGLVLKGKVSRFAETEDPTSRTMHTEIDLPNPRNTIRAGMYGIAKILLDTDTKSSTLPTHCLLGESKEGKADVYIIKDGKAKKCPVMVGADDGLRVEIVSGLKPDDEVIETPNGVVEGSPVRTADAVAPEAVAPEAPAAHPAAK